jgi:hypothetical protein
MLVFVVRRSSRLCGIVCARCAGIRRCCSPIWLLLPPSSRHASAYARRCAAPCSAVRRLHCAPRDLPHLRLAPSGSRHVLIFMPLWYASVLASTSATHIHALPSAACFHLPLSTARIPRVSRMRLLPSSSGSLRLAPRGADRLVWLCSVHDRYASRNAMQALARRPLPRAAALLVEAVLVRGLDVVALHLIGGVVERLRDVTVAEELELVVDDRRRGVRRGSGTSGTPGGRRGGTRGRPPRRRAPAVWCGASAAARAAAVRLRCGAGA